FVYTHPGEVDEAVRALGIPTTRLEVGGLLGSFQKRLLNLRWRDYPALAWELWAFSGVLKRFLNAQKADLVLGGGDLITDGFESTSEEVAPRWNAYMAMHSAIEGEHHAVIGNHDLVGALPKDGSAPANDPRLDYKRRFGLTRTYRSFDALGYHVMLLDSGVSFQQSFDN
ncbi:MAG: metallophosphoesterase, partial [SAR324 cluster bacterium]|nr:metallophosphoesterase [SAR324 cluster bacterium]